MNKKLLIAGLCLSFVLVPNVKANATSTDDSESVSVNENKVENMPIDQLPADAVSKVFTVKEIKKEGEKPVAILYADGDQESEYVLAIDQFRDDDVRENNNYRIYWNGVVFTSFPAKFGHIYRVDKLDDKLDKNPENMPLDKIPKDAVSKIFVVKKINDDSEKPSAVLYEEDNENSEYVLDLNQFRDDDVKVNNRYKIYWNGMAFYSFPAKFGHIYRVEKLDAKIEDNQEDKKKDLAISMFDSLVQTQAASILLEQSPKTVENIKDQLEESMGKANTLMDKAYNVFLNDEEREKGDKSTAILRIIQYKYDKKLENPSDQELAKSIFQNMIMTNAGRTLLEKTPETVKEIEKDLREKVEKSEETVNRALKVLK